MSFEKRRKTKQQGIKKYLQKIEHKIEIRTILDLNLNPTYFDIINYQTTTLLTWIKGRA